MTEKEIAEIEEWINKYKLPISVHSTLRLIATLRAERAALERAAKYAQENSLPHITDWTIDDWLKCFREE